MYLLKYLGLFINICALIGIRALIGAVDTCSYNGRPNCNELHISNGNFCYTGHQNFLTATASCDDGYDLKGDSSVRCQTSSGWQGDLPSCEIKDCGQPGPLSNGYISLHEPERTTYGALATVECKLGFTLSGSTEIKCMAAGIWSELPTCIMKETSSTTTATSSENQTTARSTTASNTSVSMSTLSSTSSTSRQQTTSTSDENTRSSQDTTTGTNKATGTARTTVSIASKGTVTPTSVLDKSTMDSLPQSGEQKQGDDLIAVYVSVPLLLVALVVSAVVFLLLRRRRKRKQREGDYQRNGNVRTRHLTPAVSNKAYTARPLGRQGSRETNGRIPEQGYAEINLDFEEETEYNTINVEAMDPLNPEEYGHLNTSNGHFIDTTYNHIEAAKGNKEMTGTVDTYAHIKNSAVMDTQGKSTTNQSKHSDTNACNGKPDGVTKPGPNDSTYNTIETTRQQQYDGQPAQLQVSCLSSDYGEYNHTFARPLNNSGHKNDITESSCDVTYNHATDAIKTDNKHVLEEPDDYSHLNTKSKTNTNPLDSRNNDEARSNGKKGMYRYDYAKVLKNVFTKKRSGGSRLDKQKNKPSTSEHINGTYNPTSIDIEPKDGHYFILEKQETHPEENATDDRHYFILEKQDGHATEDENHDNHGYLILKDE